MDRAKLCNINNKNCCLVEFTNYDNTLETGYLSWVNENDLENIDDIIENEKGITIYWPTCNISSASTMKTALNKATFEEHAVRILDKGSWDCMRKKLNSMLKFGVKSPDKAERKLFSKKSFNEDSHPISSLTGDSSCTPACTSNDQSSTKKESKRANESLNNESLLAKLKDKTDMKELQDEQTPIDSQKGDDFDFDNEDEDDEKDIHEIFLIKDREIEKLQNENKELKQVIENKNQKILNLNELKDKLETENRSLKYNEENETSLQEKIYLASSCLQQIQEIAQEGLQDIPRVVLRDSTNKIRTQASRKRGHSPSTNNGGSAPVGRTNKKYSVLKSSETAKKNSENSAFVIDAQMLQNCRKNTLENFTNDLLETVFTVQELAECSVTGRKCNANQQAARPALDHNRLTAVQDAVFGKFGRNKFTKTTFNYVAKNKCGSKRAELKVKEENHSDDSDA